VQTFFHAYFCLSHSSSKCSCLPCHIVYSFVSSLPHGRFLTGPVNCWRCLHHKSQACADVSKWYLLGVWVRGVGACSHPCRRCDWFQDASTSFQGTTLLHTSTPQHTPHCIQSDSEPLSELGALLNGLLLSAPRQNYICMVDFESLLACNTKKVSWVCVLRSLVS
jgi:hypothetical protein